MILRTGWSVLLVYLWLTYAAARVRWGVGSVGTPWPAGPLSPHKIFHPRLLCGMAVSSQRPKRVKVVASTVMPQQIYHILFVKADRAPTRAGETRLCVSMDETVKSQYRSLCTLP